MSTTKRDLSVWCMCAMIAALLWSSRVFAQPAQVFASPEDAVKALIGAAKAGQLADLLTILGSEDKELI